MTSSQRHTLFAALVAVFALSGIGVIRGIIALSLDLENKHSSYVVLVPIISAVLLFWDRKAAFSNLATSVWPASVAFAASGLLLFAGRTVAGGLDSNDQLSLMTATLVAAIYGAWLLSYGAKAFRTALFPLLFLGLTIPIPSRIMDAIVHFLQMGSADVVSLLFTLTGTPAYRNTDVVFVLPGATIEVAEACSGIRSTLAILLITLLAAHMLLRSNWRRTALMLAVVPISLIKNAVRIVALSLLAIHYDMGFLTGNLHHEGGVVFMMIGLFLEYPVLSLLARSEAKQT
jgi:exosortase